MESYGTIDRATDSLDVEDQKALHRHDGKKSCPCVESTIFVSSTPDDAKIHVCDALDLSDHEHVFRSSLGSS